MTLESNAQSVGDPSSAPAPPALSAHDQEFWLENGYLVVPDVVPLERCQAVQADIIKYLGLDPAAPVEDHYEKVMDQDRGGFVNLRQSQALWDTRQCPRLYQVFAEIHGTAKLSVGADQAHMKLPYREAVDAAGTTRTWGNGGVYFGPDDPRNNGGGLHWDVHGGGLQNAQTVARKQRGEPTGGLWAGAGLPSMLEYGDGYECAPQGVLYLNDRDTNGGGFRCVPGFHHRFNEWLATVPKDRSLEQEDGGHWIATHPELSGLFAEARTIPAKAGSLLIWHRLLPHTAGRNLSDTPRFAQYITMGPAPTDPELLAERRAESVDAWQKLGEPHGPLSEDAHEARRQRWEQNTPPARLTELGKQLVGLVPWE
jgi:hypothetical protein